MNEHDHYPHEARPAPSSSEDAPGETSESNIDLVREGLARWGEPFLAYLVLDGIDQRSPALLEEFERAFVGHFPDRVAFTLDRLAYNNWEGSTEVFLERLGLPGQVIRWDYAELYEHLLESYRVTERLGGLYAFER